MSERPVTIITGGSSGIGFATAQGLLAEQHRLLLVGRSIDRLEGARERLLTNSPDAEIELHKSDMGDPVQASNVVGVALNRFDRLDHLFNNAGVAPMAPIQDHTDGMIRETLYVNVLGPALAIADAWRQWRTQRDAGDTARYTVINTSSVASIDPYPGFFAYGASKAAAELLIASCQNEGEPLGVKAFAIAPGAVETPLLRGVFPANEVPEEATIAPADVAALVVECIRGDRDGDAGKTIYISRSDDGGVAEWDGPRGQWAPELRPR